MSPTKPCAGCKFQRRKCNTECIFSPYFPSEKPQRFESVHRAFGASNVGKLLQELNPTRREDAANSLVYEAEARLADPTYGCVGLIYVQQQYLKQFQIKLSKATNELVSCVGYYRASQMLNDPNLLRRYHPEGTYSADLNHQKQQQLMQQGGVDISKLPVFVSPSNSRGVENQLQLVTTGEDDHHHHSQQQQQQQYHRQQQQQQLFLTGGFDADADGSSASNEQVIMIPNRVAPVTEHIIMLPNHGEQNDQKRETAKFTANSIHDMTMRTGELRLQPTQQKQKQHVNVNENDRLLNRENFQHDDHQRRPMTNELQLRLSGSLEHRDDPRQMPWQHNLLYPYQPQEEHFMFDNGRFNSEASGSGQMAAYDNNNTAGRFNSEASGSVQMTSVYDNNNNNTAGTYLFNGRGHLHPQEELMYPTAQIMYSQSQQQLDNNVEGNNIKDTTLQPFYQMKKTG